MTLNMLSDAHDAVAGVLFELRRQFGERTFAKMSNAARHQASPLLTGSAALDRALGGGLPHGCMVEFFGVESTGKTTLALQIAANVQRTGGTVAFIDVEHSFDPHYAKKIGLDISSIVVSQPNSGEEALTVCEKLAKPGVADLIVVDSVAALAPQAEIDAEPFNDKTWLQSHMMSRALRRLAPVLAKSESVVIFTNQIRERFGILRDAYETTPGGKALKFYAAIRLKFTRNGTLRNADGIIVGSRSRIKISKITHRQSNDEVLLGMSFNGTLCDEESSLLKSA